MAEDRQPATAEKSLSYIAWSLKEISANIKKLTEMSAERLEISRKMGGIVKEPSKSNYNQELPF